MTTTTAYVVASKKEKNIIYADSLKVCLFELQLLSFFSAARYSVMKIQYLFLEDVFSFLN